MVTRLVGLLALLVGVAFSAHHLLVRVDPGVGERLSTWDRYGDLWIGMVAIAASIGLEVVAARRSRVRRRHRAA